MVEPSTIELIVGMLTPISLTVGVFYYIMTLRTNQRNQQLSLKAQEQHLETRQAQLFMPIYSMFSDHEFMKRMSGLWKIQWTDFDDFITKYGEPWSEEADIEVYSSIWSIGNYYEGIGVLVKRNLIDPTLVDDLISGSTLRTWEKFGPLIIEFRKRYGYPQLWGWLEYLYNEIKVIAVQQHPELAT